MGSWLTLLTKPEEYMKQEENVLKALAVFIDMLATCHYTKFKCQITMIL
jgi:hypothetical protein